MRDSTDGVAPTGVAWARLVALAIEEHSDAAASVQHGADKLPEVPEWARLVVALAAGVPVVDGGRDA